MKYLFVALVLTMTCLCVLAQDTFDLNTLLMKSTFKIECKASVATCFLLGKPLKDQPGKGYPILITAKHVFAACPEDEITLVLRKKTDVGYSRFPYKIKIRQNGIPLWTEHPVADVAVMYVGIPNEADYQILEMGYLADDDTLKKYEIHPGDELNCLGYPLNVEANNAGFPILRSGKIASYPITPTSAASALLYDFNIFAGNSGGPVYFASNWRAYGGSIHAGDIAFVIGLVSEQKIVREEIKSLNEVRFEEHRLGLAIIVSATAIKETIKMLPEKPIAAQESK